MLEELRLRLAQSPGKCALLIDPLLADSLAETGLLSGMKRHVLPLDHADVAPAVAPYLIALPPEDHTLLDQSLQCALAQVKQGFDTVESGHSVCAWMVYQGDLDELAYSLAHKMLVKRHQTRVFFRFIDPRVVRHLDRILRPGQFRSGLSQVTHWVYMDHPGRLAEISLSADAETPAPVWLLRDEQWDALDRVSLINALETGRERWAPPALALDDAALDGLLRRVAERGLKTSEDQLTFARNALAFDLEWDRHPTVASCLARSALDGEPSFTSLIFSLNADFWNELSTGKWRAAQKLDASQHMGRA